MNKTKIKYDVFSPDGFTVHHSDMYTSRKKAKQALAKWVKRYESQGYYSSNKGRITLTELPNHCKIVTVTNNQKLYYVFRPTRP
jgi:hypothetical protein